MWIIVVAAGATLLLFLVLVRAVAQPSRIRPATEPPSDKVEKEKLPTSRIPDTPAARSSSRWNTRRMRWVLGVIVLILVAIGVVYYSTPLPEIDTFGLSDLFNSSFNINVPGFGSVDVPYWFVAFLVIFGILAFGGLFKGHRKSTSNDGSG